jgi:CRISPR/Cas system-associated exonuclease Cas4 (RecB family)
MSTDIQNKIDKWYEDYRDDQPRYHMGASLIGHPCERYLWLIFRWAKDEKFPGRVLRLFERGQNEEDIVTRNLNRIGLKVENCGEDQLFVDLGSHVGGSIDGILPEENAILEIKTHALKSFESLLKEGVAVSKPQHMVQMQSYMSAMGLPKALYLGVCKNDDRIYTEWADFDAELAEKAIDRAQRIATQDELPPPISTNPSWWECKFCTMRGFCHGEDKVERKHCRTCAHSSALEDGTWFCEYHKGPIDKKYQAEGCKSFEMHDHLEKD